MRLEVTLFTPCRTSSSFAKWRRARRASCNASWHRSHACQSIPCQPCGRQRQPALSIRFTHREGCKEHPGITPPQHTTRVDPRLLANAPPPPPPPPSSFCDSHSIFSFTFLAESEMRRIIDLIFLLFHARQGFRLRGRREQSDCAVGSVAVYDTTCSCMHFHACGNHAILQPPLRRSVFRFQPVWPPASMHSLRAHAHTLEMRPPARSTPGQMTTLLISFGSSAPPPPPHRIPLSSPPPPPCTPYTRTRE